ncbi:DUF397 domain-containing protein [Streptomyces sp. NPDC016626]|uniref:DUF397 domain-containing protein n=1 Tax=Streptomyces sp. NPDC016626 TaxID=3364968 RepID=UPI0036FEA320
MTDTPRWFKSSYSSSTGGECLEVAIPSDTDAVHIRDSKNADGSVLTISGSAWAAFLAVTTINR